VGESVHLSRIGDVKAVFHRPVEGEIKACCVRRTSTGKWFVTLSCEAEPVALPAVDSAVGIDVGLASFATMSDGSEIEPPRFYRNDEKDLKRVQRLLSKEAKGTPGRRRRRNASSNARVAILSYPGMLMLLVIS